jgi:hypothetical protein
MKKLFLVGFSLLAFNTYAQSSSFGIKAGGVFNADKGALTTAGEAWDNKGKGSMGFQAGAMVRINAGGIYVQPELLYTSFKNEYEQKNGNGSFEVGKRRIDVPVNLGKTFVGGLVQVQAGPVLSYYFEDDISLSGVTNAERDEFNVGFQLGTGVNVKNFLFDVRYEFGFGKNVSKFVQNETGFSTENRSKLLNVSVGYFF